MISFKLAKELKDTGLKWNPKPGDWYFCKYGCVALSYKKHANWIRRANRGKFPWQNIVFAPRLDQLLEEIEQRGYAWEVGVCSWANFYCQLAHKSDTECYEQDFVSKLPEDAAARALLWILKK